MPENESRVPTTGVVGLGEIGGGIAGNLLKAGVTLSVCDIREEATAPYREGARVAASPRELAAGCDVVFVAVLNDAQVRAVLEGDNGVFAGAADGTTAVVVSTITTDTVLAMREAGARHGVTVVDCGVSGGTQGAADGQLVCMVGGTEEEVDRIRPQASTCSAGWCSTWDRGGPGSPPSWPAIWCSTGPGWPPRRPRSWPRRPGSTS